MNIVVATKDVVIRGRFITSNGIRKFGGYVEELLSDNGRHWIGEFISFPKSVMETGSVRRIYKTFEVGKSYWTTNGDRVKIVSEENRYKPNHSVVGDDGVKRRAGEIGKGKSISSDGKGNLIPPDGIIRKISRNDDIHSFLDQIEEFKWYLKWLRETSGEIVDSKFRWPFKFLFVILLMIASVTVIPAFAIVIVAMISFIWSAETSLDYMTSRLFRVKCLVPPNAIKKTLSYIFFSKDRGNDNRTDNN